MTQPATPATLALALLFAASTAPGLRAQCCTPLPVSRQSWLTTSEWNALPLWVGATDDGWVHLVLRDNRVPWLYTSSDAGASFGFPDTLFTEGSITEGITVAPDGTLLVGFQRDDTLFFHRSTDHAASWSPTVALGPMAPAAFFPHPPYITIRTRPNGLTALLALSARLSPQGHLVLVSSDLGQAWSAPITASSLGDHLARIAVTDTTVAFAYEEAGEIRVRRSTDAGRTWSAPVRAGTGTLDAYPWHELLTTGPATFQLVYLADTGTGNPEIRVAVSTDDAVTWDPANDSAIGTATFAGGEDPFALALPSGGVVVGGWFDPSLAAGVASNFSAYRGLPGTWLPAPAVFSPAGRLQHDFQAATLADDAVLVVHDDYRHDNPADCPPGNPCESIYMSRSCPGSGTWEEFRLDEDTPPNGTHSEEPAIATTSQGRLHAAWLNVPAGGLAVVQLRSMAVQPAADVPVTLTLTPAADCLSATQVLSLDSGLLTACASVAIQWYLGSAPIPGATGPTLLLDPADIDGVNAWHATLSCGGSCDFRTLDVTPLPFQPELPPVMLRTDVPGDACHPAHVILEAVPIPAAECALAAYTWFIDGSAIPGNRTTSLDVSVEAFPVGTHSFHCEARCTPARRCGGTTWPAQVVTIDPFVPTVNPPRDVGAALRVGPHGDPHAPDITAEIDWTRDEGLPRTAEHYHLLRGTSPTLLQRVGGLEPLTALRTAESTPAAATVPLVHYYSVLAANTCEEQSAD